MKTSTLKLVKIDCAKLEYHAYEGTTLKNTINSSEPLEASFVDYYRLHTDDVMASIDEPESA